MHETNDVVSVNVSRQSMSMPPRTERSNRWWRVGEGVDQSDQRRWAGWRSVRHQTFKPDILLTLAQLALLPANVPLALTCSYANALPARRPPARLCSDGKGQHLLLHHWRADWGWWGGGCAGETGGVDEG